MHNIKAKNKAKDYGRRRRGPTRFPGIAADAKAMGICRTTLWRVLHKKPGWDHLVHIRRQYEEMKKEAA